MVAATSQNATNFPKRLVRDARGHRLALQTLLGRGSFGKVYRAEDEETGEQFAVKFPLSEEDFSGEPPSATQLETYARILRESVHQLEAVPSSLLPEQLSLIEGPGGVPCTLSAYYEDTLLERLHSGLSFADLCTSLAQVCEALEPLHQQGLVHGNLRPGNILFAHEENGTRVCLTDPATSLYRAHLSELEARVPGLSSWYPPECRELDPSLPLSTVVDTYGLARLLYEAVVEPEAIKASYNGKAIPHAGPLDKKALTRFKSSLEQRLIDDNSNPHVRALLLRKASAFLTRALSQDPSPSPPYRFYQVTETASRLSELRDLFHPGFDQLGMLLLDPTKANAVYDEDEEIKFSLAFRCHGGIEDEDLIICMTYVRDLEGDQKVKEPGLMVLPSHDGNRFRFNFIIPKGLPAGRYLLRVALAIKGSPGKPTPRDLTIEVKAAPGAQPRLPRAQTIQESQDERHVTQIPVAPAASPRVDGQGSSPARPGPSHPPVTRDEIPANLTRSDADLPVASGVKPENDTRQNPKLKPASLRLPPRKDADEAGSSDGPAAARDERESSSSRDARGGEGRSSGADTQRTRDMTSPGAAAQAAAQRGRPEVRPAAPVSGKPQGGRAAGSDRKDAARPASEQSEGGEDDWFKSVREAVSGLRGSDDESSRAEKPAEGRKRSIHTVDTVEVRKQDEKGRKKERLDSSGGGREAALKKLRAMPEAPVERAPSSSRDPRASVTPEPAPRDEHPEQKGPGKPGRRFIPEHYYRDARAKPLPGEDSGEPFQRGQLQPYHELILVGVLLAIFLSLVGLIVYLLV